MLRSISLLIVVAALGGCTTGSLVSGETTGSVRSLVGGGAGDGQMIGPANRAYDCFYRDSSGNRVIRQCPMGYH